MTIFWVLGAACVTDATFSTLSSDQNIGLSWKVFSEIIFSPCSWQKAICIVAITYVRQFSLKDAHHHFFLENSEPGTPQAIVGGWPFLVL
jgi:hypothetical protein